MVLFVSKTKEKENQMTRHDRLHSWLVSLFAVVILLSSVALPTGIVHAINTPWLSVSGRFIRDPQGNNVVLRGVSLVDVSVSLTIPRQPISTLFPYTALGPPQLP